MQSYWFGDVDESGCTPAPSDLSSLVARVDSLSKAQDRIIPFTWDQAGISGPGWTRTDYIARLRVLCFFLSEREIARRFEDRDAELLQMIRTLDELDEVANALTERAVEWYRVKNPDFSRTYRYLPRIRLMKLMKKEEGAAFRQIIGELDRIWAVRETLTAEISARAETVMPNCSALLGGLVASRLVSSAGGLAVLARLPGSSIQVLGSHTALYSHIRGGTPPPKHGIIFQHRRVHNAPKGIRGRVARVLAGKLAIAARIDYYRQERDAAFLAEAQATIDGAGDAR